MKRVIALALLTIFSLASAADDVDCEGYEADIGQDKSTTNIPTPTTEATIKPVVKAKPCQIPFEYKGVKYDTCIRLSHTKFWCATTKTFNDKDWRNCENGDRIPENMPCVYPFTYKSKDRNQCVDGSRAWCAVSRVYNGQNWKYCKYGDKFNQEKPCHFPFTYKDSKIDQCTKINSNKPWCSLISVYDVSKGWKYCREVKVMKLDGAKVGSARAAEVACQKVNKASALLRDVVAAYEMGHEQCGCGWVADGKAVKVIRKPRAGCGQGLSPGVHACPTGKYDAVCSV